MFSLDTSLIDQSLPTCFEWFLPLSNNYYRKQSYFYICQFGLKLNLSLMKIKFKLGLTSLCYILYIGCLFIYLVITQPLLCFVEAKHFYT